MFDLDDLRLLAAALTYVLAVLGVGLIAGLTVRIFLWAMGA